jgi:uncharacterized 2Fe-2S/4Fe-4S cluster protein (DUF4445 family)
LSRKLGKAIEIAVPLALLQRLPKTLRESSFAVDIVLAETDSVCEVIDIVPASGQPVKWLAAAIDIGTTTIGLNLFDVKSSRLVSHAVGFNDQILFGDDVITRMVYASRPAGLEKLKKAVLSSINTLLETARKAVPGVEPHHVAALSIAGNTVMTHLLLGLDPATIRNEPYIPVTNEYPRVTARDLGIEAHPRAPVLLAPSVSGYLGGDITAGILAADLHASERPVLYVDIGTNGEMVLGNRDWMMGCACSAGPAFEGGSLRFGMRAVEGAIDHISFSKDRDELIPHTIGNGTPRGICGSGMIDLLYQLYYNGFMNQKGTLDPQRASGALVEDSYGTSYAVWKGRGENEGAAITVSEPEIENLIRTKGAVWAGIHTLLKNLSVAPADLERVIIAGNFGRSLAIRHAIGIGMLPDVPAEKYTYIGNGSLLGASAALLSQGMQRELSEIARRLTYLELSATPGYMEEFVASLFIPHTDRSLFPSY